MRVLIVEDESLVSLFLQGVLQDLGHSVSGVAPSLRTALAIAAGTPSDLAIVDMHMPDLDGFGVLDQLNPLLPADGYQPRDQIPLLV